MNNMQVCDSKTASKYKIRSYQRIVLIWHCVLIANFRYTARRIIRFLFKRNMQVLLTVILMFHVKFAATENYLLLRCNNSATARVCVEKHAGSDIYLLQAKCNGTDSADPVEIQSTDFNFPSVDEKIELFCDGASCFKETIPLRDIVLWRNKTDKTCEGGEEETSNLLPVLSASNLEDFCTGCLIHTRTSWVDLDFPPYSSGIR